MNLLEFTKTISNGILEKAKSFRADWSVNDEIDSAHVHNRPMYIEDPVEKELFNGSYSPMGQISDTVYVALLNISFEYTFHNGQVCIINFNGTTYEVVGQEDEFGVGFGNKSLTNELDGTSFEDTGEPFLFFADDGMLGMYYTGATTGTMAIAAIDTPVVIEEKYVPSLQSDWNENDIASTSYIKNRPFYIYYDGYSYVSDNTRFTANVVSDTTTYYISSISTGHDIEKCTNIKLIFDGTEYNAMPNVFSGCGNAYILAKFYGMSEEEIAAYGVVDSGEPYCLYKDGETSVLLITSLTGSTHSVNLSFDAPNYSKIDENYLPSYSLSSSGGTIRLNSDPRGIISEVNISNATTSQAGLMSSSDKSKLNSIPSDVQTQLNNKAASSHTHPYVSDMTVSGSTLTYNKGDGTTGTVTLPAGGGSSSGVGQNVEGVVYKINGADTTAKVGAEVFNDYTNNKAIGQYSHAEGYNTLARGDYSHVEGGSTQTTASYSHAEGDSTKANGYAAHAEGQNTTASGYASHAEGFGAKATGTFSHAEGYQTVAAGSYQHVEGMYNIQSSDYAHIVGNGTADNARSNAHTLDWDGNAWFKGNAYVGGSDKTTGKELATKEYVDSVASSGGGSGGTGGGSGVTYTLSKSGSNITLTGSDGSTSSVQDSDTNTTYSQGNSYTLGLTRLYSSSGTNTDGAMTQAAATNEINNLADELYMSMPAGKPYTWNLSDMTGVINLEGMLVKVISSTAYGMALSGTIMTVTPISGEPVMVELVPLDPNPYILTLTAPDLGEECMMMSVNSAYAAMLGIPFSGTLIAVSEGFPTMFKSITVSAGADESYFIYVNSGEGSDTITWDGNVAGKLTFDGMTKVNGSVFTVNDCANGGTIVIIDEDGIENSFQFTSAEAIDMDGMGVMIEQFVISINEAGASMIGLESGTYFLGSGGVPYVKSLTINGYKFSERELKLDPKYLSILNEVEVKGEIINLGDTLTWDGNTTGLPSVGNLYLVSDIPIDCPTLASNYPNGDIQVSVEYYDVASGSQKSQDCTIYDITDGLWMLNGPSSSEIGVELDFGVVIVLKENIPFGEGVSFPKKGIYFGSTDEFRIISLTIDGYNFTTTKGGGTFCKIDNQYLDILEEIETSPDTLTWNGDINGRYFMGDDTGVGACHVSDVVLTKNDVGNGISITINSGQTFDLPGDVLQENAFAEDGFAQFEVVAIIPTDNYVVGDSTYLKKGIYFFISPSENIYIASLKVNGFKGFGDKEYKIKSEYLPSQSHAVGTVLCTSTNIPPTSEGTWELIDKEFKTQTIKNFSFTLSEYCDRVASSEMYMHDHLIDVYVNIKVSSAIGNASTAMVEVCSFPMGAIGLNGLKQGLSNVIGFCLLNHYYTLWWALPSSSNKISLCLTGILNFDFIGGIESGNISSGDNIEMTFQLIATPDTMLDEYCDKFYWKRTA